MEVYNFNFREEDFVRLASVLADVKGKFLLSLNETKEVRRIFGRFKVKKVATKYSVLNGRDGHGCGTSRQELSFCNY